MSSVPASGTVEEKTTLLGGGGGSRPSTPNSPAMGGPVRKSLSASAAASLSGSGDREKSAVGYSGARSGDALDDVNEDHGSGDLTTFTQSFFMSVKGFVGVGILTLPYAMTHTGLIVGILGILYVGFMTWWSMMVLVRTREGITDPNVRTISDMAFHVFGSVGSRVVGTALIVTQFGFCCGYLVFASSTMNTLVPALPPYAWTLLILPMLTALSWLPSLGKLTWASFAGVIMIFFGVAVVISYSVAEIISAEHAFMYEFRLAKLRTLPVFLGITVAVWEGVALVIPTRAQMRDPTQYPRVLNYTIAIVGTMYLATSVLGYVAYGDSLFSIVTLNLPQKVVVPIIEVAFVIMVIFTYPVQLYPVVETIERSARFQSFIGDGESRELRTKLSRAVLVCVTGVIAVMIPNYGLVVSLVGSLGGSLLSLVLPNLLYLALNHKNLSYTSTCICWIITLTGICVSVIGTSESVYLFIAEFDGHKH